MQEDEKRRHSDFAVLRLFLFRNFKFFPLYKNILLFNFAYRFVNDFWGNFTVTSRLF